MRVPMRAAARRGCAEPQSLTQRPSTQSAFEDRPWRRLGGVVVPPPRSGRPPCPHRHPVGAQTWWASTQHRRTRPRNPGRAAHRAAGPPAPVAAAFAATTRATVGIIAELNARSPSSKPVWPPILNTPDADIYRSLPGLGVVLGARVLGEFGDDPNRYTDAKSRRNYAGTSPLTVASARNAPCWPAMYATAASPTRSTNGPSAPCWPAPAPERSMTSTAPPATCTTKRCARSATASSASCTGRLPHHTPYDEHTAWAHRTTAAA